GLLPRWVRPLRKLTGERVGRAGGARRARVRVGGVGGGEVARARGGASAGRGGDQRPDRRGRRAGPSGGGTRGRRPARPLAAPGGGGSKPHRHSARRRRRSGSRIDTARCTPVVAATAATRASARARIQAKPPRPIRRDSVATASSPNASMSCARTVSAGTVAV